MIDWDEEFEERATGDDGSVEGYGSVFGVKDSYDDVIAAGAFVRSLGEHKSAGTMPAMLWQHDASEQIGIWTDMTEDSKGLKIKGRLALETSRGKEAHALLKMAGTMIERGLMSANEWRDMEGMDPRPGVDEYLRPLNLTSGSESEAEGDEE